VNRDDRPSGALVLVATAVDAVRDGPALAELAAATGASVAYLQVGEPSLTDELDRLAASGATRIRLVRLPGPAHSPARSWVRRAAAHWVREQRGTQVQVELAASAVTGRGASLTCAAWEEVPSHRSHVLVCRGPRCTARGATETARALAVALADEGLGDDDVLTTQTGCLFPCNHGPVVVVHPDDTWYGPVTPDDARRVVAEHLVGARPVPDLQRRRVAGGSPIR